MLAGSTAPQRAGRTTRLHTSVPKEPRLQAVAPEDPLSEGTGGALGRKGLVWAVPTPPRGHALPPPGPALHLPLRPSHVDDVQLVQVLHLEQKDKVLNSATGLTDKEKWGVVTGPAHFTCSPLRAKNSFMASSCAWGSPRWRFTCSR